MKYIDIVMTQTNFELKEGTKTVYKEVSKEVKTITEEVYNNYEKSAPFFRRVGGSETIIRCSTEIGYTHYKIISKSPCKQTKIIREFDFKSKIAQSVNKWNSI